MPPVGSLRLQVALEPGALRLIRSTVSVLAWKELDGALAALHDRLLESARLFECAPKPGGQGLLLRLRPYAELALAESKWIAGDGALDSATKERRILEALREAGY